jgi:hypothetical protein
LIYCAVYFTIGIAQYFKLPKPPKYLKYRDYHNYYKNREWQRDNDTEIETEINDIHKTERIMLLDETIVKYNKLLDSLNEQYKNAYRDKDKSLILAKQIATLEKLNRALEKRKKLD